MRRLLAIFCAAWFALGLSAQAGALQTRFATVQVHNLPVGRWTYVQLPDGSHYSLKNSADRPLKVSVRAALPMEDAHTLFPIRPIPDPSWLTVETPLTEIGEGETKELKVRITVPDDPQYAGKWYEAWLVAEAVGEQLSLGVVTRVRFQVVQKASNEPEPTTEKSDG